MKMIFKNRYYIRDIFLKLEKEKINIFKTNPEFFINLYQTDYQYHNYISYFFRVKDGENIILKMLKVLAHNGSNNFYSVYYDYRRNYIPYLEVTKLERIIREILPYAIDGQDMSVIKQLCHFGNHIRASALKLCKRKKYYELADKIRHEIH